MLIGPLLPLVLMAAVEAIAVFPFVKLNPPGAVIAPRLASAFVALFRFKAPLVNVATSEPAVIAPEADWFTSLPMFDKVSVPDPKLDAPLKLILPTEDEIKALPLDVFTERFVEPEPIVTGLPDEPIVAAAVLAVKFKVAA